MFRLRPKFWFSNRLNCAKFDELTKTIGNFHFSVEGTKKKSNENVIGFFSGLQCLLWFRIYFRSCHLLLVTKTDPWIFHIFFYSNPYWLALSECNRLMCTMYMYFMLYMHLNVRILLLLTCWRFQWQFTQHIHYDLYYIELNAS